MCARYTLRKRSLADIADTLQAEVASDDEIFYKPRYNVGPTDVAWVVLFGTDRRLLRPARWRYSIGAKRILVNIRSETVAVFGRFRDVFTSHRCAVVTDGFYEWSESGEPVWFHASDDGLVLLGGLLQFAKVPGAHPRFSILTTRPNALVAKTHDRMPVIIGPKQLDDWLTGDAAAALNLLSPAPSGVLVATDVSNYVNIVKHDDPGCVAPRAEGGRRELF